MRAGELCFGSFHQVFFLPEGMVISFLGQRYLTFVVNGNADIL